MVKRWACNLNFVSAGYIPRARGGGDPESYIRAFLQMVRDAKGHGLVCMFVRGVGGDGIRVDGRLLGASGLVTITRLSRVG